MLVSVDNQNRANDRSIRTNLLRITVIAALPILVHLLATKPAEPVFGGDSNRHMMTSVFFRDFLADGHYTDPKGYAENYFEQYPALGLLVWPPLFHGICGAAMLAFGTSVTVARLLILGSLITSTVCVYRIARRVADEQLATVTAIVFATMPIIFQYGRDVMLEMPTMAFVLISVDQFDLWLSSNRRRSLYFAAVAAAMAALTRFDAAVLLPFYFFAMMFRGAWKRMLSVHVLAASLIAICIIAPVYVVIVREMGALHLRQAAESVGGSVDGSPNGFVALKNLWFYPLALPEQTGSVTTVLSLTGIAIVLIFGPRNRASIPFALMLATYLTFTPLAEQRARHGMYWLPSMAFFAVVAVDTMAKRLSAFAEWNRIAVTSVSYGLLLSVTATASIHEPAYRVTGYRQAAEFVLQHTTNGDRVFFDGWWDGNFTYHMRHLDPGRSRHVIRGDRLLYDFVCVPSTDFQAFANSDREMLQLLTDANPKYVVLEYPQFFEHIEVAEQLRTLVHSHPEQFVPVQQIDVDSSLKHLPEFQLQIFQFDRPSAVKLLQSAEVLPDLIQHL